MRRLSKAHIPVFAGASPAHEGENMLWGSRHHFANETCVYHALCTVWSPSIAMQYFAPHLHSTMGLTLWILSVFLIYSHFEYQCVTFFVWCCVKLCTHVMFCYTMLHTWLSSYPPHPSTNTQECEREEGGRKKICVQMFPNHLIFFTLVLSTVCCSGKTF